MTRLAEGWNRFWFEPQPTSTLALVRIAAGLLSFAWALSLLPDLLSLFSSHGVLTEQPANQGPAAWGPFQVVDSPAAIVVGFLLLVAGSIALTVGFGTRVAAVVVSLCLLAFQRRNPFVVNSGDGLLRLIVLFVALAPAGAALSLDRLRRARDRFWEFPQRAPWALRLIQITVTVLYLSTVWQKARGTTWNDGTAFSYALRVEDIQRFPMPAFPMESLLLSSLATYGTLAAELAIGILIWNRVARPYVIALGVALHLSIDYSLRIGFFSYAVFAAYLAFVPPATARRWILAVRDWLGARIQQGRPATAD